MARLREDAPRKRGEAFPPEIYVSWGRKIRARREQLGETQEAFANRCGVDQSTVSRLERGELYVHDRLKWKIAGALFMTVDAVFPYPNTLPPAPEQVA